MRSLLALLLATLPLVASAQTVTMPQSVKIARGRMVQIELSHDGDDFKWSTPPELDVFRGWSDSPKTVVLLVLAPPETPDGTYQIFAVTTKCVDGKAKLSPFQSCLVTVGGGPVKPPPPVDPPVDPPPVPLAGMRVLAIYESDTPLPKERLDAIFSPAVDEYMRLKCLKGADGKTPEWRRFDDDPSLAGLPKPWQDLRARLPPNLPNGPDGYPIPQVAIGDSSGVVVHSGPYPASEAAALELFKRFGGN